MRCKKLDNLSTKRKYECVIFSANSNKNYIQEYLWMVKTTNTIYRDLRIVPITNFADSLNNLSFKTAECLEWVILKYAIWLTVKCFAWDIEIIYKINSSVCGCHKALYNVGTIILSTSVLTDR